MSTSTALEFYMCAVNCALSYKYQQCASSCRLLINLVCIPTAHFKHTAGAVFLNFIKFGPPALEL